MTMNMREQRRWAHIAVVVTLFLIGCGKSMAPPPLYTAAAAGAGSAEMLVEDFKEAYAAHDTDAAMRLFYWSSADAANDQQFWLRLFSEMFSVNYESMELISPPDEHDYANPQPKTALPIVARLRVIKTTSASRLEQVLLIGKNDQGFYFVPPINERATSQDRVPCVALLVAVALAALGFAVAGLRA